VLLLFNPVTFCGYSRQYPGFNVLKERFGPSDKFEIIGFPSNQFARQEPGRNDEILNGIKHVRPGNGYVPNFPMSEKIDVNGADEHPLYNFLKRSCPAPRHVFLSKAALTYEPLNARDIRWNFEKFLVDGTTGIPFRRYDSGIEPADLVDDIQTLLDRLS